MHVGVIAPPESFHTQKWVQGLQSAGVDVSVFSFSKEKLPNAPCIQIKPRFTIGARLTYLSYLGSKDRLAKALLKAKVDVVNPLNVTPFGVWAREATSLPLACVAMGADVLEYPPHISQAIAAERRWESAGTLGPWRRSVQQLKWHFFRHQVDRTLRASQLITGDNLELVHAVRDWFHIDPSRVLLNRWGIEPELFEEDLVIQQKLRHQIGLSPDQKMILSPRGLKPVYQADLVLAGFQQLLAAGERETKLVVMGTGYQTPPQLDQWATRLHQQYPNFHYQRDLLPREWMPQLWHLTDAFVNIPAYDGFSNALNEGRYAGAVPIINDIPAHREVCEDGLHAYYLEQADAHGLANCLQDLIPKLDSAKAQLALANQKWVEAQAVLLPNMKRMREWMQDLL